MKWAAGEHGKKTLCSSVNGPQRTGTTVGMNQATDSLSVVDKVCQLLLFPQELSEDQLLS